ncbi:hypothetical protein GGR70_004092 [Xanthomonas campestris]|nr:hypothetical protein [Xanthomonas campestris]
MPVQYQNVNLYNINEITGQLCEQLGRKPTVKVVDSGASNWLVEVHDGVSPNSNLLGYLYDGQSSAPTSFSSKSSAAEEVLWAEEFLVIELPR